MALNKYISLEINGEQIDLDPDQQVPTIDYALEDEQDFEQKKSAEALNITMPATLNNQANFNTMHNASVVDNTADQIFDKPQPAKYIANGHEVLIGKFFYGGAKEINGRVTAYTGKLYGLNGDWVIDLKEKTLYDFLNPIKHTFDAATVIASWSFNGQNEALDFVYAPARYRKPFGEYPAPDPNNPDAPTNPDDTNVILSDLKPSFSIYYFLYRAFRSVGYKINSIFLNTDYFRRKVMPWTWGGFDYLDDSRWEPLKFLAKANQKYIQGDYNNFPDWNVVDNVPGAFDNSGTYQWINSGPLYNSMVFTYLNLPTLTLGKVFANFSIQINLDYKIQNGGLVRVRVHWYKNGVQVAFKTILSKVAGALSTVQGFEFKEDFQDFVIEPGDYVACRVHVLLEEVSFVSFARVTTTIEQFSLNYIKLTEGSTIDFANYPKFKNYKWMDLLRGVIDLFDLEIGTDPVKKEVYIEPTHSYEIDGVVYPGYYTRKQLDWSDKVDISQESFLELFSDYEREFIVKFKDDTQDGGLKKVQDRNQAIIGLAKYVLPERFKSDKKTNENRFFSALMHYDHDDFKYITGIAPQLPAIIPENIANTSSDSSENTFQPKVAHYKGNIAGVGGWKFNGVIYKTLPFMFAVNYKAGGETDPVLSYSDQNIAGVVAKGLLKKFFLQRMAILRFGRKYDPLHVRLNNYDVINFLHRESIIIRNLEFLLTHINGYDPISEESTACKMWMFVPVSEKDADNTYPSIKSIQTSITANSFDVKYWQHKLLVSDVPK